MRIRAGQLAVDTRKLHAAEERAASRMATLYPFMGSAPLGVALWSIPVEADEEFCALLLKREEALAGKSGSVHEVESALSARAEAMAKAVLEEEEALAAAFPFLGRSVKGALCVSWLSCLIPILRSWRHGTRRRRPRAMRRVFCALSRSCVTRHVA
ncbi:Flagellar Member 3 [Trypanosoma cruzi]|uniref:Flagellar Member 3 n=1 Tax=Trypanosoma cruzi TaxID=5693 RepID=A0A2V2XPC8_TRYCR|nr:Flagellar Member 3 [Trypanosoma cruzi]